MRQIIVTFAIMVLSASAAWSAEEILYRRDGGIIKATLLGLDKATGAVTLKSGGTKRTVALDEFAPSSAYRVKRHFTDRANAQAVYDLGVYCMRKSLLHEARREFLDAEQLDEKLRPRVQARLAEIHELSAAEKLDLARKRLAEGKADAARAILRSVPRDFPGTRAANEARKLLESLDAAAKPPPKAGAVPKPAGKAGKKPVGAKGARTGKAGGKPARLTAKQRKRAERLKALRERLAVAKKAGEKAYQAGLVEDGDTRFTRAQRAYQQAEKAGLVVREILAALSKEKNEAAEKKAITEQSREANAFLINVYMSRAHLEAAQLNFKEANRYTNRVLAMDPTNRWALMLRQRVTEQRIERSLYKYKYRNQQPGGSGG